MTEPISPKAEYRLSDHFFVHTEKMKSESGDRRSGSVNMPEVIAGDAQTRWNRYYKKYS